VAGVNKLIQLDIFVMILEVYAGDAPWHTPHAQLRPAAIFLSLLECVTGLGLIFDWRGFLTLVTVEMVFFIGVLLFAIWLGLDVDCGCFVLHDPNEPVHDGLKPALYRDLGLLVSIGYLFYWRYFFSKNYECHIQ